MRYTFVDGPKADTLLLHTQFRKLKLRNIVLTSLTESTRELKLECLFTLFYNFLWQNKDFGGLTCASFSFIMYKPTVITFFPIFTASLRVPTFEMVGQTCKLWITNSSPAKVPQVLTEKIIYVQSVSWYTRAFLQGFYSKQIFSWSPQSKVYFYYPAWRQ